jgi:hypothetical protein
MLGGLTDHVPAVGGKHCALNCEGIGFCTAAGEDDVVRLCADQVGHLCPCGRQRGARLVGVAVTAGRVAKVMGQVRQCGLGHSWVCRCGRVVVQIDRPTHEARMSPLSPP